MKKLTIFQGLIVAIFILVFCSFAFAGISLSGGYIYKDYNFSLGDVNANGGLIRLNYTFKNSVYIEGTGIISKGDAEYKPDREKKDLTDHDYSVEAGIHIYERGSFLTYSAAVKFRYWKVKIEDIITDKTKVVYLIPIDLTLAGPISKKIRAGLDIKGQIPVWDKENITDEITGDKYKLDNFIDSNVIASAFVTYKKFKLTLSWNYEPMKSEVRLNNGIVSKYDKTVNNYMVLITYRF